MTTFVHCIAPRDAADDITRRDIAAVRCPDQSISLECISESSVNRHDDESPGFGGIRRRSGGV